MDLPPVTARILALLEERQIPFELSTHAAAHTSAQAAQARGTRLEEGAKSLICKAASGKLVMAVLPAHLRLSLKALKEELGESNMALASPEEVLAATGLAIGSIPPFGMFWDLPVLVDKALLGVDFVAFSAGSHTHSLRMPRKEWLRLVPHRLADITQS